MSALQLPVSEADEARRRGLRRMRALATGLLVFAAIVYVVTRDAEGFLGYVNAGAEASMVGAIADWFAVTALFRHPLGLPVPHTAIIPKRKESLGASLQDFVAENFLNEEVVRERVTTSRVSAQVGGWLVDPGHAEKVIDVGAKAMADGLARVKRDDVAAIMRDAIIPKLLEEPLAPAAGQLLAEIVADRAHVGAVDLMLTELHLWLNRNADDVQALVGQRAPWWSPVWLDEKVALWVHGELLRWVAEIRDTPRHLARRALDDWLAQLAENLQHNPVTQQRAEQLKQRVLAQEKVIDTSIALWDALRRALIASLEDDHGMLRQRAIQELHGIGRQLVEDHAVAARLDELLADGAAYVVNNYGSEIATVISATVNRWDGQETAERIELHVGRDLQFIRINGTVVGGLAGVAIHAFSHLA
ncbi:MAG TPA: DUF445 domain-containing protein [Aeromicrobium sp.]|nr:DUF445 domain-containing protein [Aeromicrobium sp.]HKY56712.1 DUF445 domain-containing protein [Aeromicrobium sp.]